MIHFLIVFTTSHPAINTQAASNIAAIIIAQVIVIALDHTAGHILLATSLAHIFIDIYNPKIAAMNKKVLESHHA
jgi:hypothetical protein